MSAVVATDASGTVIARVPRAEVTLSMGALLTGQIVPRTIDVEAPMLRLMRTESGAVTLDIGGMSETVRSGSAAGPMEGKPRGLDVGSLLAELSRPLNGEAAADMSRLGQLRRLRVRDAVIKVVDLRPGLEWEMPGASIDLQRAAEGGLTGAAATNVAIAGELVRIEAHVEVPVDGSRVRLRAHASELRPAALLAATPRLGLLTGSDVSVTLSGDAEFASDLTPLSPRLQASLGEGIIKVGRFLLPVRAGVLEASGTLDAMTVTSRGLEVMPRPGDRPTVIAARADVVRSAGTIRAMVAIGLAAAPDSVGSGGVSFEVIRSTSQGLQKCGRLETREEEQCPCFDASASF